jgi:anti-anti-sigma factor
VSSPGLDIATAFTGSSRAIEVAGEIDHTTADELLKAFERTRGGPGSELVLDLARVGFLDSVGLRTLIEIERAARERGLSLRIVSPPEHVRAVFRLSGTESLLRFAGQPADGSGVPDYPERVEIELAVGERAPSQARAEVRQATAGKLSRSDSEVAVLLTSELVTNAVVHPRHRESDSIGLRISTDTGRARVEVADSGGGFDPTVLKPRKSAIGGHGLRLVDRGAVRWGISRGDRFRVWFELAGRGAPGRGAPRARPARDP